jgi:hypothetical protein
MSTHPDGVSAISGELGPLSDPAGFRTRYRSEPGMIGHYPWTYADWRRRKHDRPECEYEDLFTTEQVRAMVAAERERQGRKIETLLRGITEARCLMDPIWRERMGAESVREHVQRGIRCLHSAVTDCRFTEPTAVISGPPGSAA